MNRSIIGNQQIEINKLWYTIYVRSKHEKTVYEALLNKGVESSLPMKTIIRQWSDRKKKVKIPMFRGYVFVNINLKIEKLYVLKTPGVVKFIQFNNLIPTIPAEQIFWINAILKSEEKINFEAKYKPGENVEVIMGPFKGLKGSVIKQKSLFCVVLWIDIIMQGVSVEIDPANLAVTKMSNNHSMNINNKQIGSIR